MQSKIPSKAVSIRVAVRVLFVCLCGSCTTVPPAGIQGVAYTPSQIVAWQNYLAVSPLSNDVIGDALTVQAKASTLLPPWYRQHILKVASNVDLNKSAELSFAEQYRQITHKHNLSKQVLPPLSPHVYDALRGNEANASVVDSVVKFVLPDMTVGILDANYRAEVRRLAERIWEPILAETRELILAEYDLTNEMRLRPTEKIAVKVRTFEDERMRGLIVGVWKEGTLFPTVWVFYSDGTYAWEHPFSNKAQEGKWEITQARLCLTTRFDAISYHVKQSGRKLILTGPHSKTLNAASDDVGDYSALLRQIKGGGYGAPYNFRIGF